MDDSRHIQTIAKACSGLWSQGGMQREETENLASVLLALVPLLHHHLSDNKMESIEIRML